MLGGENFKIILRLISFFAFHSFLDSIINQKEKNEIQKQRENWN